MRELIAGANVIEFRDGTLVRIVRFREGKMYEIVYDERGRPKHIVEKDIRIE